MDITSHELKTMKVKQLRKLIREAITEVLNENIAVKVTGASGKTGIESVPNITAANDLKAKNSNIKSVVALEEDNIDEMARIAKGFRLADPEINSTTFTKTISGTPLSSIIDYFRANPGAEVSQLQRHFQFVRPQIANAVVKGLLDAGVLTKLTAGGEVVPTVEPDEEAPVQATEPEDLFMGSATNPLSMYFDNEPNDDGTEDFNAEEEPTTGELEPTSTAAGSMSDEDYDVWMKWSDLNDRLSATKSNILKAKRNKGGKVMGDIGDTSSNEISRLTTLKQSLEDRMNDLVAKSKYLQKKIEKETGKAYEPIEIEPEEEDTLDEAYNAEYEKRKLQFYAGIIK